MSEPVNLNRFRKQKLRADKRARGDANAGQSRLSKAEKTLARARTDKARRDLDGHKGEE